MTPARKKGLVGQAGKPDLLPCRGNGFPAIRRRLTHGENKGGKTKVSGTEKRLSCINVPEIGSRHFVSSNFSEFGMVFPELPAAHQSGVGPLSVRLPFSESPSLGMMLPPPGKAADRTEDRHAGCRIVPSRPRCPPPPCRRRRCGRHPGKPGGLPRASTGRDDVPSLRLPERPGGRFPLHRGGMGAEGRASANASASDALGDPA